MQLEKLDYNFNSFILFQIWQLKEKEIQKKQEGDASVKKEYREELLSIDRVTRVTAGGRQLRFRAVMVLGDGKGKVGLGTGKSWEVVDAIAKAISDAKKRMVKVKIEEGTVPYNLEAKFKAAKVMVHPASKGT